MPEDLLDEDFFDPKHVCLRMQISPLGAEVLGLFRSWPVSTLSSMHCRLGSHDLMIKEKVAMQIVLQDRTTATCQQISVLS